MQRIYIDTNSSLGRTSLRDERLPFTAEQLREEMEYYRIHAALVFSNVAKEYSFVEGNRQLLEDIKGNNRLFGVGVIIPGIRYELKEGLSYYDMLVNGGVKAFKVFPTACGFGFNPFILEEAAQFMIEKNILMMVDLGEINFDSLRVVLNEFSKLKVLLCGTSWSDNRNLFKFMEKYENLYFDISSNHANEILALSKKYFGLDRVLFGTGYPNKVMGALKALVEYSGLSEEDKNMVAAGNAARLFNIDLESIKPYDEAGCKLDSIARQIDCGQPLKDILVIDSHTHMVDKEHQAVSSVPIFNSDEDTMMKRMDLLGIDKIFTIPWEGILTVGDSANETALRARNKYPDRIEAYAMFNPNYYSDIDRVIDFYHEKCRFPGIKTYQPRHKVEFTDKKYERWFEYGDKNRLIALMHSEDLDMSKKIEEICGKYKNLYFIIAHSGISYEVARYNIGIAKKYDNVFLEITYTSLTNGVIELMVEELGADRVLYGSDMPMRDPAPQLAWVCYARISEEDKKKILGGNIKRMLERCYSNR